MDDREMKRQEFDLNAEFDALLRASEQTYAMAEEQDKLGREAEEADNSVFDTVFTDLHGMPLNEETMPLDSGELPVQTPVLDSVYEPEFMPMTQTVPEIETEDTLPQEPDFSALMELFAKDAPAYTIEPEQNTMVFSAEEEEETSQETMLFTAPEAEEEPVSEPEETSEKSERKTVFSHFKRVMEHTDEEETAETDETEEAEPEEAPQTKPTGKKKGLFTRLIEWIEEDDDDPYADEEEPEDEPWEEAVEREEEPEEQPAEIEPTAETGIEQPEESADEADESEEAAEAEIAEEIPEEVWAEEEAVEAEPEETDDTPIISEQELAAFLQEVDADTQETTSFEQILHDNDMPTEQELQRKKLETFPEKETMVYFDVTMPKQEETSAKRAEVFDIEQVMEEEEQEKQEVEEASSEEPSWMTMDLEQLSAIAPSMQELRVNGAVMAREIAREKERIVRRYRAYMAEQNAASEQPDEQPEEQPEEAQNVPMPEQPTPEPVEQEEGSDPVFLQRSADTPETESDDLIELETDEQRLEQILREMEQEEAYSDTGMDEEYLEIPIMEETLPVEEITVQTEDTLTAEEENHTAEAVEAEELEEPYERPRRKKKSMRKPKPQKQIQTEELPSDPAQLRKLSQNIRLQAQKKSRRSIGVLIISLIAIYISCAMDFVIAFPLPTQLDYTASPDIVLLTLIALQVLAMALAYDTVAAGIRALRVLQPNFNTLVDLMLLLNLIHCGVRLYADGEELPFAAIAILVLYAMMRTEINELRALHYAYKTAVGTAPTGIFLHEKSASYLVKAELSDIRGFLQKIRDHQLTTKLQTVFFLMALVCCLVLSVTVCASTGDLGRLIYVLAATMTGACQIALLCPGAMGKNRAARHLMKHGCAVCGLEGAGEMSRADHIVLTDEDLFPNGSILLDDIEVRGSLNGTTSIAYAAALAGNSSLGMMLAGELHTRYGTSVCAEHVIRYTDGGLGGRIGGQSVLLGSETFVRSHGIPVENMPENGLALLVGHEVMAILRISYKVPSALYNAMQMLLERKFNVLLHTRNQQVTPEMVEKLYGLPEGFIGIPELELDRAMGKKDFTAQDEPVGYLARGGLTSAAECAATAKSYRQLSMVSLILGVIASVIGMLLMAYFCYLFIPAEARPIRILIYMILWLIPVFFITNEIGRD